MNSLKNRIARCSIILCGALALPALAAERTPPRAEHGLRPRTPALKPERMTPGPFASTAAIYVKFRDDAPVRLRDGVLDDLGTAALAAVAGQLAELADPARGGRWERLHGIAEDRLDRLRREAQERLERATADLNTEFLLWLPALAAVGPTIDALNALDIVEIAWTMPEPVPPPTPPDFTPLQGYFGSAPDGIAVAQAWGALGSRGSGVRVADCEYTFNPSHTDLPTVTVLGPPPVDPGFGPNHGTAVLGVVGGIDQGWGVTGICSDAEFFFAGTYTSGVVNIAAAITHCLAVFAPGDIIMLEAQMAGPLYQGSASQFGLVPVEWDISTYNAIVTAVGNGVVVVEAAGNGSQDLDAPIYATGNGGHWPFLPENDSGAIIVGAGAAPSGSDVDRARLWYSNFGAALDLQGWGEQVCTTGYGTLYAAGGPNQFYTATFGGTSSATPIVAGACALIQSIHLAASGGPLPPPLLREVLVQTGSPQQGGTFPASQKIGPRPDLAGALVSLGLLCLGDLDGSGGVDSADLGLLLAAWGACSGCPGDLDGDGVVGPVDVGLLLGAWGPCG
ncbi:MAG TPA: S8 family serine peptidase [Phycisphaerales bacterium]|nr:S8 family serine peptidase [Phycisphaerales bacterium]HMP38577.1 S8 family serine peptidase [Phycisphaerales bacterium]